MARTNFKIDKKNAHKCIAITCVRYLVLCATCTTLAKRLPDIKSWTSKNFGDYTQYLDERPLAIYALCYLEHHIDGCHRDANVSAITSRFIDELTQNPAVYLLESWVSSHLNKNLLSDEQGDAAKDFRNKLLHSAVRKRFLTAAEVLLTVRADVNSEDKEGQTPLSQAAESGHEVVLTLLLEKGASLESGDKYGQTPLSWAAGSGHEAIVKLLLENGASLESRDKIGWTPLLWAARSGHEAIVKLLLEKGASMESRDKMGWTPLIWAARSGYKAIVKLLLEKGASLESRDKISQISLL